MPQFAITDEEFALIKDALIEKFGRLIHSLNTQYDAAKAAETKPVVTVAAKPAPYGYKADGTPKKLPGRPRKARK